jgi:hypothetical protein
MGGGRVAFAGSSLDMRLRNDVLLRLISGQYKLFAKTIFKSGGLRYARSWRHGPGLRAEEPS